jgi:hypothetical protein
MGWEQFKAVLGDRIEQIDYTNFKNSVKGHDLHNMYLDFWSRHRRYQDQDRSERSR